jgi:hypothetical protein
LSSTISVDTNNNKSPHIYTKTDYCNRDDTVCVDEFNGKWVSSEPFKCYWNADKKTLSLSKPHYNEAALVSSCIFGILIVLPWIYLGIVELIDNKDYIRESFSSTFCNNDNVHPDTSSNNNTQNNQNPFYRSLIQFQGIV